MTENVYIHIPFCKSKCKYCSFISFPRLEKKDEYISALKQEIKTKYRHEKLKTLYLGGGTPSLLAVKYIQDLLYLFDTDKNTEITIEINPETIDKEYLSALKEIGVNRISIGCQTFDNEILKTIGRIHNAQQVIDTVKATKECGFENISLDFIYGLPNQNCKGFINDLKEALSLDIQHISLYGLKIEEGCFFYKNPPKKIANDDTQAQMYLEAIKTLEQSGFEHYEISNFAKPNFYSRHNLNYWNNNSYYGFGLAAHGYESGIRYSNFIDLDKYINNPLIHENEHSLSLQEKIEEEIFLGFRRMKGLDVNYIDNKFGIDFEKKYSKIIQKYIKTSHVLKTTTGYKLSNQGILVSNLILSEFLD